MIVHQELNPHHIDYAWDEPPLSLLDDEQKMQCKRQAQIRHHVTGEQIWSSHQSAQFWIVTGRVRLIQQPGGSVLEPGRKVLLAANEWFGDALALAGQWSARAASKDVVVVSWRSQDWDTAASDELTDFWEQLRQSYQPHDPQLPYPASGYPHLFHLNTAAACLTLVTQHFQAPVPLKQVQRQVRGQSPQDLVAAAEKLRLRLQRVETDWQSLAQLSFPALLLWQQQHWVVVWEVKGSRMIVADPMNSRKTCESLPRERVEADWNGQLWLIEPFAETEQFNLKWFLPAVWRYRSVLSEVLIASLTLQIIGLATPTLTQVIIDKVIAHGSLSTLNVMAIALLCIALFETGLGILRLFTFTHTARRLDLNLSAQLFRHLLQLPLSYFESHRVGDTIARAQELESIRQFLTGTALTVVLDGVFVVVYLVLMVLYSGKLTLVSLAIVPFFVGLILFVTPILKEWLNESFNRRAESQSFLVEAVSGIHALKAHGAELPARERWEGLFAKSVNKSFHTSTLSNISSNLGDFLTKLSELMILWYGAQLVIESKLTVGQLVAFQMLSGRAIGPLLRIAQLWQTFQQVLLSVDRIGDILNTEPEAEPGTGLILPPLQGAIAFEKVCFRYKPELEPVLKGVSFTIQPGLFIGIVGRSGSGKSTLSKLLPRLYQPEEGQILLDGIDIKGANLVSLRNQIGVVLQDDFLFDGSVIDNITLGNQDITLEQVETAARLAAAEEFIRELPDGFYTHIGERGTGLSGGQRQRLALSRLFLSEAPILILDEATSALDSETEQKILYNLRQVSGDRTVLMIAHRFAPLRHADAILVMEKGRLVEQGNHEELLAREGVYWSLYQRQQATA